MKYLIKHLLTLTKSFMHKKWVDADFDIDESAPIINTIQQFLTEGQIEMCLHNESQNSESDDDTIVDEKAIHFESLKECIKLSDKTKKKLNFY